MTEPTAEARAAEQLAHDIHNLPCRCPERGIHVHEMELVPLLALALHAYRQAGVEQAEKERDEIRTKAALRIEEARAEVRRVWVQAHNITLDNAQKIMHIAALEAELARVRKS